MKITQAFTETVVKEIELETPAFFQDSSSLVGVYSEDRIISVLLLQGGYTSIRCNNVADQRGFSNMVKSDERITEQEFNAALAQAILNISRVGGCQDHQSEIAA